MGVDSDSATSDEKTPSDLLDEAPPSSMQAANYEYHLVKELPSA